MWQIIKRGIAYLSGRKNKDNQEYYEYLRSKLDPRVADWMKRNPWDDSQTPEKLIEEYRQYLYKKLGRGAWKDIADRHERK